MTLSRASPTWRTLFYMNLPVRRVKERTSGYERGTKAEIVQKYLANAGGYGVSVAAFLAGGFRRQEIEDAFSGFDEDYHISRFFQRFCVPAPSAEYFQINGFPQTHVSIDSEEIQSIL